jgi:hypothetical protein
MIKEDDIEVDVTLRRLAWIGPLTVLASIGAVLLVRALAIAVMHPDPTFLPLTVTPAILDTTVLVSLAVFVFRVIVSGRDLPGPLLALAGARLLTADRLTAFRLVAFRALLVSFVPDALIAVSRSGYWRYGLALAAMHVAAWVACVSTLMKLAKIRR